MYPAAGVQWSMKARRIAIIAYDGSRPSTWPVPREIVVYLKRSGGQLQYSQPLLLQTQAKTRFSDLAQWIRGNLQGDLTFEMLAERVNLSPRHFARKFKATFGIAPADFVQELRLDEARWQLVNSEDPIMELADAAGDTSDDTFRRAFERCFGIPPVEYRDFKVAGA